MFAKLFLFGKKVVIKMLNLTLWTSTVEGEKLRKVMLQLVK